MLLAPSVHFCGHTAYPSELPNDVHLRFSFYAYLSELVFKSDRVLLSASWHPLGSATNYQEDFAFQTTKVAVISTQTTNDWEDFCLGKDDNTCRPRFRVSAHWSDGFVNTRICTPTSNFAKEFFSGIRPCSHLVPKHSGGARLSLGTNVNTPFFQGPISEFGHGICARVQGRDVVPSVWAQHHFVPVPRH